MTFVVDGIQSTPPESQVIRHLFEFLNDHPYPECSNEGSGLEFCHGCSCVRLCCMETPMRWHPGIPIVRFTSEGLQVS